MQHQQTRVDDLIHAIQHIDIQPGNASINPVAHTPDPISQEQQLETNQQSTRQITMQMLS